MGRIECRRYLLGGIYSVTGMLWAVPRVGGSFWAAPRVDGTFWVASRVDGTFWAIFWADACYDRGALFFFEVPQFGSLRPLSKPVLEKNKPLPDEKCHGLGTRR